MAVIHQRQLFGWEDVEELGDLERLVLVLHYLPDEELMKLLERGRGNGRNDYPVRPVWNSIIAGIVFQHQSIESLRRELKRNGQLREVCGFDNLLGVEAVPTASAYSRFCQNLLCHTDEIERIFFMLVEELKALLPNFGEILAMDSKAIDSLANGPSSTQKPDGRRDTDADFGRKEYKGKKEDGTVWKKVVKWFGYKLHLIVDAVYELPVHFSVTNASASDVKEGHKLIDEVAEQQPEILEDCDVLTADKGYDDTKLHEKLWDEHETKPVIDNRNMWKDGEDTRLLDGTDNIVFNYEGNVSCYCPETNQSREMAFGGFEKDRDTLKFRCPAVHYGLECEGMEECSVAGAIRIPLENDRRVFTPVARSSYKWTRLYNMRSSVERVNGRLDEAYGFEKHFIRGLQKMKLRCSLALIVMLAMAVGRIREKQDHNLRSLVKTA